MCHFPKPTVKLKGLLSASIDLCNYLSKSYSDPLYHQALCFEDLISFPLIQWILSLESDSGFGGVPMFSMLLPLVHQSHMSVTCHSHGIPSAMDLGVSGNATHTTIESSALWAFCRGDLLWYKNVSSIH